MKYHKWITTFYPPEFTRVNIAGFTSAVFLFLWEKANPTDRGFPNGLYLTLFQLMYLSDPTQVNQNPLVLFIVKKILTQKCPPYAIDRCVNRQLCDRKAQEIQDLPDPKEWEGFGALQQERGEIFLILFKSMIETALNHSCDSFVFTTYMFLFFPKLVWCWL